MGKCVIVIQRSFLTIFIMKKILLIPALILTLLIGQVASAAFSDVNESTIYKSSITWMSENGVIQGYPDGTFKPDQCVNRAEFLKMLFLTLGTDIIITDSAAGSSYYDNFFSDTSTDEWYWPYVNEALHNKTIIGYPDGTFKPGQCVKRVEAIKMAVLEFGILNEDSVIRGDNIYRDAIPGENWFDVYLYSAVDANAVGIEHVYNLAVYSMPEVYFSPGESMSRKEVAEMLYRMKTLTNNGVFGYIDTMAPNSLNYYISPSSGVSFLMPDGWWVIHDGYYENETPGDPVADYPTILINGPTEAGEETVAINQRMMDCDAATCFDINDNYEIGVFNPSSDAMHLMNRIMLTFREPAEAEFSSVTEIAFDGCGVPSSYSQEDWWTDFVGTWDAYALTLEGSFPLHDALTDDLGDYCLALDKSLLIFIPAYIEDGSGKIFSYDIVNDIVTMAQADGYYMPHEFGARNGDYIPIIGIDDYYGCEYQVGNYYYLENRLETVVDSCTIET